MTTETKRRWVAGIGKNGWALFVPFTDIQLEGPEAAIYLNVLEELAEVLEDAAAALEKIAPVLPNTLGSWGDVDAVLARLRELRSP